MATVSVNIKMYRVGELGDCFLLRFTSGQNKTHVLIDCGSFRNSKESINRMKEVAADIKKQIGNAPLDIIAGTHQHNDHLSGFVHAQKIFESMKPEQVWLSWLDNPADKQARQIGKDYNNYLTNLRLIAKQMQRSTFADSKITERVQSLLGFYGVTEKEGRRSAKTDSLPPELPAQAREILRKIGKKNPNYLKPGQVFNLPGISDGAVKVYVLGPPKNEDLLYDKEPNKDETFDPKLAANSTSALNLLGALKKLNGNAKTQKDEEPFPFN
jgi:hypothetical protein